MLSVDDSNQTEFRYFLQKLAEPQISFKKIVQFFGYDQEAECIEKESCGLSSPWLKGLLRVIHLPNCKEEIHDVNDCLARCCNLTDDYEGLLSELCFKMCRNLFDVLTDNMKFCNEKSLQRSEYHVSEWVVS